MRQELRRFRSAILLILAFTLGLGAQLLQAQVTTLPRSSTFSVLRFVSGGVINWNASDLTLTHSANTLTLAGGVIVFPVGTVGAPPVAVGAANTGIYSTSAGGSLDFAAAGVRVVQMDGAGGTVADLSIRQDYARFLMGANTDLRFIREAAAILQMGDDDASPTAQTFKGPDARAGTDTDTAGGDITFAAGRGTGTGNPGNIYFSTGATNTSGTGAGPLTRRLQIASSGVTIIASHTRFNVASSTTGTGSALLGANAPIGQVSAPYVWIAVIASDGTAAWVPAWR